ncbi:unnamed protein product [Lymnaea stagnalis]|uniref:U3 small nucleolar RNA-associated protein 25 homolog n=1 Tax=Lymnaea stagnalis TaxID=6523 RepID=A0AAV2H6Q1_LYMST
MAPKRRKGFGGGGKPKHKRKKLNLMTIRQKKDIREFGEIHPVENTDSVKKYTSVKDTIDKNKVPVNDLSSDESDEEEIPVIKQLLAEIGVQEEEPDSEKESDEEEEEEVSDTQEIDHENDLSTDESDEDVEAVEEDISQDNSKLKEAEIFSDEEKTSDPIIKAVHSGLWSKLSLFHYLFNEVKANLLSTIPFPMVALEEDEEEEDNEENGELSLKESDPFTKHFEQDRDISALVEDVSIKWQKNEIKLPGLGDSILLYKDSDYLPEPDTHTDLKKLHVKHKLCSRVASTNRELAQVHPKTASLTHLQHRLFCAMNCYQDLLYPKQTCDNTEEIRLVYCLHALNHVLKTRSRVIAHNAKLKNKKNDPDDDVEYRDQGLTRPKVLILLPYRDRALKVVNMIISLLSASQQASVSNKKRFEQEYSELEKGNLSEKTYKPEDFRKIFEGNTDDNFRVGLSVSKKSLRLYSPFYESDIILASPLGLRMIIGLEGDHERDYDFLSSIEVLIIDQADIFLMQNWDHFTHVFKHLHLQPRESHGVDFSRVRMWSINGWSKHYRQTLIFSSVILPELLTIFNKHCHNFTGKIIVQRDGKVGTIRSSITDSPQIFHRVPCDAPDGLSQRKAKFDYFKKKIIPYHTSAGIKHTLIYCNYYSFVMLRNYFRESETDFLFMNEYDTEKHMRNARIHFRKRHPHFMLYTERLHFFYRFKLRAIHHILWFDLPQYPHFYPELVNLMETSRQACTTTALFTKYDAQKLIEITGKQQAGHLLNSEKSVNMITMS